MKFIPDTVADKLAPKLIHVQKASPQIMFVAGTVGIVTAGVLACRSTLKVSGLLEDAEKRQHLAKELHENGAYIQNAGGDEKQGEKDYAKELLAIRARMVLQLAKMYALPLALGAVSIGLITGSHVVLNRRNASLTAAYATVDQAFKQYRDRVKDELGQDGDDRFRFGSETVTEAVKDDNGKTKKIEKVRLNGEPSDYARLFSEGLEDWQPNPELNLIFLRVKQNYLNQRLAQRGHVFLNEVYDELGLERSSAGQMVGWVYGNPDGDNYIDFGIYDEDGNPRVRDFVNLKEETILLDFNVDGVIYNLI